MAKRPDRAGDGLDVLTHVPLEADHADAHRRKQGERPKKRMRGQRRVPAARARRPAAASTETNATIAAAKTPTRDHGVRAGTTNDSSDGGEAGTYFKRAAAKAD